MVDSSSKWVTSVGVVTWPVEGEEALHWAPQGKKSLILGLILLFSGSTMTICYSDCCFSQKNVEFTVWNVWMFEILTNIAALGVSKLAKQCLQWFNTAMKYQYCGLDYLSRTDLYIASTREKAHFCEVIKCSNKLSKIISCNLMHYSNIICFYSPILFQNAFFITYFAVFLFDVTSFHLFPNHLPPASIRLTHRHSLTRCCIGLFRT